MSFIAEWISDLWPIVSEYGKVGALIILLGAIAWFAPSLKIKVVAVCAALILVATTAAFTVGVKLEHDRCVAAQLRAEREAKQRDQNQGAIAAKEDQDRLRSIETRTTKDQERVAAHGDEFAKHHPGCVLDADDVRRLQPQ